MEKYGFVETLRAQGFWARAKDGYVMFNQREAEWVFDCEDFKFAFFQNDRDQSPYLSKAFEHELLTMHWHAHARLWRLVDVPEREPVQKEADR